MIDKPTCAQCHNPNRKVRDYRIYRPGVGDQPGKQRILKLCSEHALCLEELLDLPRTSLARERRVFTSKAARTRAVRAGRA